jgi:hypothetical protein
VLFVLICTEGDNSEPECLVALDASLKNGQVPQEVVRFVEVLPIPLGGNQGHTKLVEKANEQVKIMEMDPDSLLHLALAEVEAECDKWIVCDYDALDESKITLDELRDQASKAGYRLVVNKPKFEYFVLCLLIGTDAASKVEPGRYFVEINKQVDVLNERNKTEKGFTDAMNIPHYSKKKYVTREFFGKLFSHNIELLDNLPDENSDEGDQFTEMSRLINAIQSLYS